MTKQDKLIQDLCIGLKNYYNYTDNIEDVLCKLGLDDTVFEQIPPDDGTFTHKDCRFLLDEVEQYLDGK